MLLKFLYFFSYTSAVGKTVEFWYKSQQMFFVESLTNNRSGQMKKIEVLVLTGKIRYVVMSRLNWDIWRLLVRWVQIISSILGEIHETSKTFREWVVPGFPEKSHIGCFHFIKTTVNYYSIKNICRNVSAVSLIHF